MILVLEALEKRKILKEDCQSYPPEATSGVYNRALFWWLNPLFMKGFRKTFSISDLYALDKHLAAPYLHVLLGTAWVKGSCPV